MLLGPLVFISVLPLSVWKVTLSPRQLGTLESEIKFFRMKNICSGVLTRPNHCGELGYSRKAPWIGCLKTHISGLVLLLISPLESF